MSEVSQAPVTPDLNRGPGETADVAPDAERLAPMPDHVRHDDDGESGFTLIELMVVIVIIGLLAAIVTYNVLPLGDKGKIVKAKADISTIEGALDLYKLQNDSYPSTTDGLQALVSAPADADASKYQRGGYIKKLPVDPWGKPYLYAAPGAHGEADVWTLGADKKEGGEGVNADIGSWQ